MILEILVGTLRDAMPIFGVIGLAMILVQAVAWIAEPPQLPKFQKPKVSLYHPARMSAME